jgi:hypothetical protein
MTEEHKRMGKIFTEIMAESFAKTIKNTQPHIQEV